MSEKGKKKKSSCIRIYNPVCIILRVHVSLSDGRQNLTRILLRLNNYKSSKHTRQLHRSTTAINRESTLDSLVRREIK